MKKLGLLLVVIMLSGACASPTSEITPTPMPTSTPAPTDTPAPLAAPTPTPLEEIAFIEPIRREIFDELVDVQGGISGNEEARATVAQQWGISVDAAEKIILEGLEKGWLMPTATPIPPTPTPRPTSVPRPTQPADTSERVAGWRSYESLDGSFTVQHPSSWEIVSEKVDSVSFGLPEVGMCQVYSHEGGGTLYSMDDRENLENFAALIVRGIGDDENMVGPTFFDKSVWRGSLYKGYSFEFLSYYVEDNDPKISRDTWIWAGDDSLFVGYTRFWSEEFTAEDYATIETILESLRAK